MSSSHMHLRYFNAISLKICHHLNFIQTISQEFCTKERKVQYFSINATLK